MRISKSDYLIGRQCSRRLWLAKHGTCREPAVESDDIWEMRELEAGEVEQLVESLYDQPIRVVERPDDQEADEVPPGTEVLAKRTWTLLHQRRPMFQAYLQVDELLAVVDILEPRDDAWYLWEVKASTGVAPLYDHDLAFQVEIATRAGLEITGAGVWLLNKSYVRGATLDPRGLLQTVDRTHEVFQLVDATRAEIKRQLDVISVDTAPNAMPGPRCKANREAVAGDRPSACGHLTNSGYCGKTLPKHWNGRLPNLTYKKAIALAELQDPSIEALDLDDVESAWTEPQTRMIQAVQTGKPWIDPEALHLKLDELRWPIAYVDFEFDPGMAVPRFAGTWPYARIPFQWSMHIQRSKGDQLEQPEPFLWLKPTDPRQPFLDALLDALPESGSIVVHSKNAELTVLRQLGHSLGTECAAQVAVIEPRLFDTVELLQAGYYHPAQQGSYSIKKVAPALLGRGYEDLEIRDGMTAVVSWKKAIDPATAAQMTPTLVSRLLEYCGRDTVLMHDIVEAAQILARDPIPHTRSGPC